MALRSYQQRALDGLREAFRARYRAVLLSSATGSGKTHIIVAAAQGAIAKGNSVLVIAHRIELIRQAAAKLGRAGIAHGIIAPGYPQTLDTVQVGSVQTLARRLAKLPPFALLVIDEAHHAVASQYEALIAAQPQAKIIGMTATPARLDGRGLGRESGGLFDCLVSGPQTAELVRGGYLTPSRVFAPAGGGPDLSGVRTLAGDYDQRQLADLMDKATITGDAVSEYTQHCPGAPAIVFCVSVKHAGEVAEAFCAAGWRAVAVHGGSSPAERDGALGGLASGAVQVVCSCSLIDEGLDVPRVGCVIDLAPTKSLSRFLQRVGRGLRPYPGKAFLTVLDHAGNTQVHGFAETPREWSLEGRKRRQAAPPVRQCPDCFAVFPPQHHCPVCGYEFIAAAKARQVEAHDGELVELHPEDVQPHKRQELNAMLRDCSTLADIQALARKLGYKSGWAWMQYKARQGRRRGAAA